MATVAPAGGPRHGVQNYPGRRPPLTVPFSGRSEHSGRRQVPKPRPKLTKAQKKALKWARKHPESETPMLAPSTWGTATNDSWAFDLETQLAGFLGRRAATQGTVGQLASAVRLYTTNVANWSTNASGTSGYWVQDTTPVTYTLTNSLTDATSDTTGTVLHAAPVNTITITSNITGTVTLPMSWADWNAEWVPASNYARCKNHEWREWQSRGHASDFLYDPNDRLQKERIRRERLLQQEAEHQRLRMEREAAAAEARRRWEAEAPARAAAAAEAEQKRQTALARSYTLLFRHLTDEQKNMLETENRFLIISQSGHVYEIRRGIMHNIFRLDEQGRAVEELCCYIPGVPEGDVLLGQMLHLMSNEEDFRRGSNRWELRDMSQVDRRLPLTGRERPTDVGRILLPRAVTPLPAVERRAA